MVTWTLPEDLVESLGIPARASVGGFAVQPQAGMEPATICVRVVGRVGRCYHDHHSRLLMTHRSRARNRVSLVACGLVVFHAGCGPSGGASRLVDPLTEVTIQMNREGLREKTWSYRHENAEPYWIVAAPAGTQAHELDSVGLPADALSSAQQCLGDGEAVVVLAEATRSSCMHPVRLPELRELYAVQKNGGEETAFTLRRDKGNPWLAALQ